MLIILQDFFAPPTLDMYEYNLAHMIELSCLRDFYDRMGLTRPCQQ